MVAEEELTSRQTVASYADIAAKGPKQTPEEVRASKELFQQFLATGMIAVSESGRPTHRTWLRQ